MTSRKLTVVADGFSYLEGPRWHRGRLWLSDFYRHTVVAVTEAGEVTDITTVPEQPSGLGWLPDGRLLVVSMLDRTVLRLEGDELVVHAELSAFTEMPINDMVVDDYGRAYVGTFGFDLMAGAPFQTTSILKVEPDGSASIVADELAFPNGMVITPDGASLLVAETFGNRVSAFTIAPDGSLGPRRDWANFGALPNTTNVPERIAAAAVGPDGCCLDAEGALWVADALHRRVVRVAEGGEILDEISTGADGVYACTLGGADGRTLYLCVAPNFHAAERSVTRLGRILSASVDVAHAGTP